jgi:protein-S-isoprenylcysteine O-methyltransferase Ste14
VTERLETPAVPFPPPLLFAGGLACGWLLNLWLRIEILPPPMARAAGITLIALGVLLALTSVSLFRKAGTNVRPDRPVTALVFTGPYKFTRNPMYVSMTVAYVGAAIWMQSLGALLLLPLVLIVIRRKVIAREEAYLERRFGHEYTAYRARVRRWL